MNAKTNEKTQVKFLDGATFDVPDFLPEDVGSEMVESLNDEAVLVG